MSNLAEDVCTIGDLRTNPEKLLGQTRDTGRPVFITVEGQSKGVLVDPERYEQLIQALNMARALLPAEEDVKQGRVRSAEDCFAEFWHDRKLQRQAKSNSA